MGVARVNQAAVDAQLTQLASRGGVGRTWREACADGMALPSQEAVLDLANDVLGTLERDIAGHSLIDVLSLHEDAYVIISTGTTIDPRTQVIHQQGLLFELPEEQESRLIRRLLLARQEIVSIPVDDEVVDFAVVE